MPRTETKKAPEKLSEAECKALYSLITKKDLTDEEKAEIKATVESHPQILTQKEFTKNFKLTDFAATCSKAEDLPVALTQNTADIETLNQVLTNLKDCRVMHNGKVKSAAACLLDMPILENGELIGTQLAKNIHFLGTAQKSVSDNPNIATAFSQSETFYRSLYATDGFGAYRDARNFAGQKVEKLMLDCIAAREGGAAARKMAKDLADAAGSTFVQDIRPDLPPINDTIESVKTRPFMAHPTEEDIEKGRDMLIVEPAPVPKSIKSMTVEEAKEYARCHVLTVDQAREIEDKLKEDKNEAEMSRNVPDPHRPKKHEAKEKFKECDVIDYMYQEWFLAGLSWLFDKSESLIEWGVDKIIDDRNAARARRAEELHIARDEAAKKLISKAHKFEDGVKDCFAAIAAKRASRDAAFEAMVAPLRDVDFKDLDSEKERELKAKYGAHLIDGLKNVVATKGPEAVTEFINACPQRYKNACKIPDKIEELALQQVKIEMLDEVMRSTSAWRQDGKKDFISDEEILKTYNERFQKRREELSEAVAVLRTEAGIYAESEWLSCDTEEKKKAFIKENVLDVYDQKIEKETDPDKKARLTNQKDVFNMRLSAIMADGKLTPEEREASLEKFVLYTITEQKVSDFLNEQKTLTNQAQKTQDKDMEAARYSVNGMLPQKDTQKAINEAQKRRQSVIQKGIDDEASFPPKKEVAVSKDLYEAAFQTDKEKIFKAIDATYSFNEKKLEAMRGDVAKRKAYLAEVIKKIQNKAAEIVREKALPMYHGRRI